MNTLTDLNTMHDVIAILLCSAEISPHFPHFSFFIVILTKRYVLASKSGADIMDREKLTQKYIFGLQSENAYVFVFVRNFLYIMQRPLSLDVRMVDNLQVKQTTGDLLTPTRPNSQARSSGVLPAESEIHGLDWCCSNISD